MISQLSSTDDARLVVRRILKLWIPCVLCCIFFSEVAMAQYCRIAFTMTNKARHVIGEVNAECSWPHSVPFGNWGVSSNFGGLIDGEQFRGWKYTDNKYQWNSCTSLYARDSTPVGQWYNHDHNANGLGDDQWSDGDYWYANSGADVATTCPIDLNGDGICDFGGCKKVTSFGVSNQFLSLYELDWPDGDDFITTLYVDTACCSVSLSCTTDSCPGPVYSAYYTTTLSTDTAVEARVRLVVRDGIFLDPNGRCREKALIDPRYDCH